MTRTPLLVALTALALTGGAGCGAGSEPTAVKTDSFKTSTPPAGYVEEMMKKRDTAGVPNSAAAAKAASGK